MTDLDTMESLRDEAFRKIGRNVVNFQKIESLLKVLVLCSRVDGKPETSEITHLLNEKRIQKRPLGDVASMFVRNIIDNKCGDNNELDSSELKISFRFNLEMDLETATKEKRELQILIRERNQLIHQELANFDFECEKSCRSLIVKLDEQNERVRGKHKQLKDIWEVYKLAKKELIAHFNSDEFRAEFFREQNGT